MSLFAGIRTAIYMSGFVLLGGWLALSVRRFDPGIGVALPSGMRPVGMIVMAVGAIVVLLCGPVFAVRGHGTPAPFDPPREFVTIGPYRYLRNPMYIGGLLLLIGFGLHHLSVSVLLLAVLFALLAHVFVVLVEEAGLERRFGESYLRYKQSVNRWLPTPRGGRA